MASVVIDTDGVSGDFASAAAWEASFPGTLTEPEIAEARNSVGVGGEDTATFPPNFTNSAANYCRLYVDPDGASASNGTYAGNPNSYRLSVSGAAAVLHRCNYLRLEGVEFGQNGYASLYRANTNIDDITIQRCVFKGDGTGYSSLLYLYLFNASAVAHIENTIVYDATGSESRAIYILSADVTCYLYHNTIVDCSRGIQLKRVAQEYVKNNIVDCTDCFNGTFTDDDAYNDYNMQSDDNAGEPALGSHGWNNTTITYENEAGDDFHMDATMDGLYECADVGVAVDFDNEARSDFDVGADELLPSGYTLSADPGDFTLSGSAASLLAGRLLLSEAGAVGVTGAPSSLLGSRRLVGASGSFNLSGALGTLLASRRLLADVGEFLLAGQVVGVTAGRFLPTTAGAFLLTGNSADLSYSGAGALPSVYYAARRRHRN